MYCFDKTSVSKYDIVVQILTLAVIKVPLNLAGSVPSDKDITSTFLLNRDDIICSSDLSGAIYGFLSVQCRLYLYSTTPLV